jgi:kynureninase
LAENVFGRNGDSQNYSTTQFTSEGLQAHPGCLVWQDVDESVLDSVARQIGADEPENVSNKL